MRPQNILLRKYGRPLLNNIVRVVRPLEENNESRRHRVLRVTLEMIPLEDRFALQSYRQGTVSHLLKTSIPHDQANWNLECVVAELDAGRIHSIKFTRLC